MKELLILSGKGGTGKTTIASSFIELSKINSYADCDVDAPNLHLLMKHQNYKKSKYYGFKVANIDLGKCNKCGLCVENCRFDAINNYQIDNFKCEGCGLCASLCPNKAITLIPKFMGNLLLAKNGHTFSTAKLEIGSGSSGRLVSAVKKQLFANSKSEIAIIDGSPGIGCPVIASLCGATVVLVVAEASRSGFSDMKRIIKTAMNFDLQIIVCVNKYDLNIEITKEIKLYCKQKKIIFAGCIPYDNKAIVAINNRKPLIKYDCPATEAIKKIYYQVMKILGGQDESSYC